MKTFIEKIKRHLGKIVVILAISITGFFSAGFVESYFEVSKNLDIMATMYREVNQYYVDDIDPAKLMRTGIEAMLESLDPYTNYISESEIEDYRFMTTGQYGGIGARISIKDDFIVVADIYKDFPADKAGLRVGDLITEAAGESTKGKSSGDVSKLLKGSPGSEVEVKIKRLGEEKELKKTIIRDKIEVSNVPYYGMAADGIAYIRLRGFTQGAGNEVREALNKLKSENEVKGVVLDLRGNPGGLLHEAVNVTNVFVDKGEVVVTTKGKAKEWDKTYKTINSAVETNLPVAVLTNSGSASASEIVSGVIQDYDRGLVVGQRSFGKGLVQTTRPLSYNAKLKVTTAKYYTPSGRCIQALDYANRNEDGSVGKVPDTLMQKFTTRNGRTVYDGGGVNPDIVVDRMVLSNISISLLSKRLIFDYATEFRSKTPSIPAAKNFEITEAMYEDFLKYISDKDYDYITNSEKQLETYKEYASKEKYFDAIEEEFNALHDKMLHDKKQDLVQFKDEIKQLLKEEIVNRYYYEAGQIEATFNYDQELAAAIKALNDSKAYKNLLKSE